MPTLPLIVEPDPDQPDCATVLVDASVAGRPYRFVLDTGAGRTTMVSDGYTSTLPSHARHTPAGAIAARDEDLVVVPSVELGSHVVPSLEIGRVPHGRNMLGMDVLGSTAVRFDFARAELSLHEPGTTEARWPLERGRWGHPFVDVCWPGVTARACWDSGASATVVNTAFFDAHRDLFEPAGTATVIDSTGARAPFPLYLMRPVGVGDLTLDTSTAAVLDLPQLAGRMDLVLGYPAFSQATWTFDFPANRWAGR